MPARSTKQVSGPGRLILPVVPITSGYLNQTSKVSLVRGHPGPRRPGRLPRSLPAAESLTETATPGGRIENWEVRSWAD